MSKKEYQEFCRDRYSEIWEEEISKVQKDGMTTAAINSSRLAAQRNTIDRVHIEALLRYSDTVSERDIWSEIGKAHKINVASLSDFEIPSELHEAVIDRSLSAHQSWIKSSGHSFERYISNISNDSLLSNEIRFVLQTELTSLIKANQLTNTPEDIKGLQDWGKDFDLYAIQSIHGDTHVFGCIQSKTSIRDRVGRDVTFSLNAMEGRFWSVAVTLDGSFLNMPEFINMVNGGGSYSQNGWHGMYAMSGIDGDNGRIYRMDDQMRLLTAHAVVAAKQFIADRRRLDSKWIAN